MSNLKIFNNTIENVKADTADSHIYYDILITNLDSSSTEPIPLSYKSNRSQPIIMNCSEWYFSIIRFTLDTLLLPVFIPTIDLTSTSTTSITLNELVEQPTIYSITLTYSIDGKTYVGDQTFVQWLPESLYTSTPNNTSNFQDNSTNYYSCYSYTYWINLCNAAFLNAFNTLKTVVEEDGSPFNYTNPPFFVWNNDTAMATLNADLGTEAGGFYTLFYNGAINATANPNIGISPSTYGQISIFFNSAMYNLFNSFPCFIYGYGSTMKIPFPTQYDDGSISSTETLNVPGGNVQILCNPYSSQNILSCSTVFPFISSNVLYIQVSQEYSTTPAWNPVKSLVFVSDTIPIVKNDIGSPYLYNGSQIISQSSSANIIASITDFTSSNADYRGFINYTPSGEYRLIDMMSNTSLNDINVNVYWQDRVGNLIPFYLLAGCSCTIKMMFRSKLFNSSL
jgi:hypothetical protein